MLGVEFWYEGIRWWDLWVRRKRKRRGSCMEGMRRVCGDCEVKTAERKGFSFHVMWGMSGCQGNDLIGNSAGNCCLCKLVHRECYLLSWEAARLFQMRRT